MDCCFSKNNIVNISQGSFVYIMGLLCLYHHISFCFFKRKRVYMFINNVTFHSIYQLNITYIHYLIFKPACKLENTNIGFLKLWTKR